MQTNGVSRRSESRNRLSGAEVFDVRVEVDRFRRSDEVGQITIDEFANRVASRLKFTVTPGNVEGIVKSIGLSVKDLFARRPPSPRAIAEPDTDCEAGVPGDRVARLEAEVVLLRAAMQSMDDKLEALTDLMLGYKSIEQVRTLFETEP